MPRGVSEAAPFSSFTVRLPLCGKARHFHTEVSMLFSPVTINKTEFKNRIIFPSMLTRFAASGGEMSDQLMNYHVARAVGGAALNMLEATCVHPSGICFENGLSLYDDRYIRGLSRFTAAIHAAGGKAGVQLNHGGLHSLPAVSGHAVPLVSFVPGMTPESNSRVLDEEEIHELVEAWGQAARRAVEAGFDIVDIHGAHGYLIGQFLSPLTNRRTDAYGGDFERRMRFPLEVIRSVRKAVGPDFPVSFRCSVEEFLPGGITLDLGCRIAREICAAGVDLFNVSSGTCTNTWYIESPAALPAGFNGDRARAVRRAVGPDMRLAVAARIGRRDVAEGLLAPGGVDMVCMGRALIADPELPRKLMEGRDEAVRPCIYCCEGCCKQPLMSCALNPEVGREGFPRPVVSEKKKVIVVGSGPAGMEFARTAASLGHSVVLYEEHSSLAGKLGPASIPPGKSLLATAAKWFEHSLAAYGVVVRTGVHVTADMLKKEKADVVFVATGSKPVCPGFLKEAASKKNTRLHQAVDVLEGTAQVGHRVMVLGGGLVGCESAAFLADRGCEVTIVELRADLAPDMEKHGRFFLLEELKDHHVTVMTEHSLNEVFDDGRVTVKDCYGNILELPAFDGIVLAVGYSPDQQLCADLSREGIPFLAAGDCTKTGKIFDAVHSAHDAALKI